MAGPTCTAFEDLLRSAAERRQPSAARHLVESARHCPDCRAAWENYQLLELATRQWVSAVPSVDFADAVLAHHALEREPNSTAPMPANPLIPVIASSLPVKSMRVRHGGAVVAAAAALVLMIALLMQPLTDETPRRSTTPNIAALDPATSDPMPAASVAPMKSSRAASGAEWDRLIRDAGTAYLSLASRATDDTVAFVDVLVHRPAASLPGEDRPPTTPAATWMDEARRGFSPIGTDMGRAVEFLLDAVPLDEREAI